MFRNPLKTQSPRRWHDRCERHLLTIRRQWIPVGASELRTTGPNRGARTRANELRRFQTMGDRTNLGTEILPGTEPEFIGPARPLEDKHDTTTAKETIKFVKNCGDCEPGGFGSTYGFSPR